MENWTMIQAFTSPQDAYMAKNWLESGEMEVLLQDEMTAQVYNFYSNAIGGVKLLVRNSDVERAIALLKEGGYLITSEQQREEDWVWVKKTADASHCPFCHSDNVAKVRNVGIAAIVLYFLLGMLFPLFRSVHKCYDCNKSWRYKR